MGVMRQATHDGDEETNVSFRQHVSYEVVLSLQDVLKTVQGFEDGVYGRLISSLSGRKSGFVHAIYESND